MAFSLGSILSFFTGPSASVTTTAGDLQAAASQLSDLSAALTARLKNIPADEVLTEDVLDDAATLAGGPWAIAAPTLVPLLVPLVFQIIAQNKSATPGALVPIAKGTRGTTGADA